MTDTSGHWMKRLHSIRGPALKAAQAVEDLETELAEHDAERAKIVTQLEAARARAEALAHDNWSPEEIEAAKAGVERSGPRMA